MTKLFTEAESLRRKFAGCRTMGELAKSVPGARYEEMKFIRPSAMPEPTRNPEEPRDWLPLLDDAVQGLPEKYRVPLVLCELQGLSRAEAADKLDLAPGTLSSRLARGRELLRGRLVRRGVSVSAVALAAVLASQASASVAPGVRASSSTCQRSKLARC